MISSEPADLDGDRERTAAGQSIIGRDDAILVTGAAGFIGVSVVRNLVDHGFRRVRCLVRPSSDLRRLRAALGESPGAVHVQLMTGNLLSQADAHAASQGVQVVFHLAAGTGSKSFPDAFLNSVVTTRNLLEAVCREGCLKRFVNVSSFAVYTNASNGQRGLLDESSQVEPRPQSRAEAYCYAKVRQDELVTDYGKRCGLPFVIVRPGVVYGPDKHTITGRVGIDTFGVFLHLGGSNPIPFTYVDNCAAAIVLAGLRPGVEGEVFNIVDDDLPTSRQLLRAYKRHVRPFHSVYLPKVASYLFCLLWEKYSAWSQQQLPPVFTRREWRATWRRTAYSNEKLKRRLGWKPQVATQEGLRRYFEGCREALDHA